MLWRHHATPPLPSGQVADVSRSVRLKRSASDHDLTLHDRELTRSALDTVAARRSERIVGRDRASPVRLHQRRSRSGKPACGPRGGDALMAAVQRELLARGATDVLVTPCGCLGPCFDGPNAVVYPDGVWYGGLDRRATRRRSPITWSAARAAAKLGAAGSPDDATAQERAPMPGDAGRSRPTPNVERRSDAGPPADRDGSRSRARAASGHASAMRAIGVAYHVSIAWCVVASRSSVISATETHGKLSVEHRAQVGATGRRSRARAGTRRRGAATRVSRSIASSGVFGASGVIPRFGEPRDQIALRSELLVDRRGSAARRAAPRADSIAAVDRLARSESSTPIERRRRSATGGAHGSTRTVRALTQPLPSAEPELDVELLARAGRLATPTSAPLCDRFSIVPWSGPPLA